MSERKIYEDAAKAFRYTAERLCKEAARLESKAARKRAQAIDQLRMESEMESKAAACPVVDEARRKMEEVR